RGVAAEEADRLAREVLGSADPAGSASAAVEAIEEGEDVVGSSIAAALSSFCFFASGAAIPVLPFLFGLPELVALAIAVVLVGLALMLTGATVGVLSGGPPLRRAVRQLAIGLGAAAVTYCLGLLFGTATA
ncbi:MAG: vacuolar iron transporter family protein, partial [Pseudonocardiales bacterium]|nr:vacuolar iron transporter family protein [Pseudonocardiales bacterium]